MIKSLSFRLLSLACALIALIATVGAPDVWPVKLLIP